MIKYQNSGETQPRLTDRAIRSLVKIYDVEEYILQEDLQELMKRLTIDGPEKESNVVFPDVRYSDAMIADGNVEEDVQGHDCLLDHDSHQVYQQQQLLLSNSLLTVSGLWLLRPVCKLVHHMIMVQEFKEKWADRCQMTYMEGALLAQATASKIASGFGEAVDSTMPSMRFLSAHFVNAAEAELQIDDSDPLGLIQMIRRTDFNYN